MKSFIPLLSVLPFVSGSVVPRAEEPCPYHKNNPDRMVEDDYRVLFHDGHTLEEHFYRIGKNLSEDAAESFNYIKGINGYRVRLDYGTIHDNIRFDPGVQLVEHNGLREPLEPFDMGEPVKIPKEKRWTVGYTRAQSWWLRMTNVGKKVDNLDAIGIEDNYYREAGEGTKIYVLDTGMNIDHQIFENNGGAENFMDTSQSPYTRDSWDDGTGHGSHVAGIAASRAPAARIVNVKVISDTATDSDTIQAISDVVDKHKSDAGDTSYHGAVINMSFREIDSASLRKVIAYAIASGIPVVTSAGNANEDQGSIPCGYPSVQCVAACKSDYSRWPQSNYGKGVTIVAPGHNIYSAYNDRYDDDVYTAISGTSQASPFVAGVLAHYIGYESLTTSTSTALRRLSQNAVNGALFFPRRGGTPNKLVNTGFGNPDRLPFQPYYFPRDEVKMAFMDKAVVAEDSANASNISTITITTAIPTTGPDATLLHSIAEPSVRPGNVTNLSTDFPTVTAIPRGASLDVPHTTLRTTTRQW